MKFEIDVNIPDGFEPTGEYRPPRDGDWFLDEYGGASCGRNPARFRLILREKPLAYEDFDPRSHVRVSDNGSIVYVDLGHHPEGAREVAAALIAAADHVDRVNAQKERS